MTTTPLYARPEGWPPAGEVKVVPLPPRNESVFEEVARYRTATSPPADLRTVRLADWLPVGTVGADHALVPRPLIFVAEAQRLGAKAAQAASVPVECPDDNLEHLLNTVRRWSRGAATFARLALAEPAPAEEET